MNNDLKPVIKIEPFRKFCMTIGELPTSYLETMTYYEMLVWFTKFLGETVIPTVNNNGEAVSELQTKYIELKNYIDTYFDNLDLQEEVNNKLDEMVEQGTLQEIIAEYLNANALWCFDSINDMKAATNLINGSYARTIGYYTPLDGGEAIYHIRTKTNSDVDNGGNIIVLDDNTLVAEMVIQDNTINLKQFGAKGNNSTDDTTAITNALSFKGNDYIKIIVNADCTFLAHGLIDIYSNTDIIINGIIKDNYTGEDIDHHNGLCFRSAVSNANTQGYGATKNINVIGGKLDGGSSGLMFALLHGENIEFKDIYFYNCCVGTHIMDLCGCKNVRIKNCEFYGNLITNSENKDREMIQPDYARYASGSYWGEITGYDNLPTVDFSVENCSFKKGMGTYYPNAIGTHGTGDLPHKNIVIKNCEFYDCTKSCIRLPKVENLLIENNNFYNINTGSVANEHYGIDLTRISESPISTMSNNIKIIGNKFINESAGTLNSIMVYGDSTFFIKDVIIKDNIFNSNWVSTETTIINKDGIRIGNISNILIDNNIFNSNKISIYKPVTAQIDNIKVNNNVMNNCRDFIHAGGTFSEEQGKINNLNEANNIWNDSTGSINLNNFIATIGLTNNGTLTSKKINWETSDNPFIVITSNANTIKINKAIHRYRVKAGLLLLANGGTAMRELSGVIYDGDISKFIQLAIKNINNGETNNIFTPPCEYIRTNMHDHHDYLSIACETQSGDYILPKIHNNYLGTYLIIEGF